jgi:hypothetical protein
LWKETGPWAVEETSVLSSEKPTEVRVVPIKREVFYDELISTENGDG